MERPAGRTNERKKGVGCAKTLERDYCRQGQATEPAPGRPRRAGTDQSTARQVLARAAHGPRSHRHGRAETGTRPGPRGAARRRPALIRTSIRDALGFEDVRSNRAGERRAIGLGESAQRSEAATPGIGSRAHRRSQEFGHRGQRQLGSTKSPAINVRPK